MICISLALSFFADTDGSSDILFCIWSHGLDSTKDYLFAEKVYRVSYSQLYAMVLTICSKGMFSFALAAWAVQFGDVEKRSTQMPSVV